MTNISPALRFTALPAGLLPAGGNGLPPVLLSATTSGAAGGMSIALDFSTAMAAGSGAIYVTDGAVETVIDRLTGQPAMRVVGATDTHLLSASDLSIDGSQVRLDLAGLLPGHSYSVVMGSGVLLSSGHVAFGGVRDTSQLSFSTPSAPETATLSVAAVSSDGSVLKAGGSLGVTITFSEAIRSLDADALAAPNASISDISTSDGGLTWHATLQAPTDAVTAASNLLTLDLGKVQDLAGHAGSGSGQLASYAVDTQAPEVAQFQLDGGLVAAGQTVGVTLQFSEPVLLDAGAFSAPDAAVTSLHSSDGGLTWTATLVNANPADTVGNQLTLDLSKVHDLAGNPGGGSVHAAQTYDVDIQGPTASIVLDSTQLEAGGSIGVTITLSEQVDHLPAAAFSTPNATLQDLHTTGGLTWHATLVPSGGTVSATNAVGLDLSQLQDAHGIAGAGVATSGNYTVDTTVATYVNHEIDIIDDKDANGADHVSNDPYQVLSGTLSGALLDGQHVALTIDGQPASAGTDGLAWFYGGDGVHVDDGVHSVTAQVVDDAGHASAAFTQQFTIDTMAPGAPTVPALADGSDSGGSAGDAITRVSAPTLTGHAAEGGGIVMLYDGVTLLGTAAVQDDRSWSFTVGSQPDFPATLADGVHNLSAKQIDTAGNASDGSALLTVLVDTAAPAFTGGTIVSRDGDTWLDLAFNEPVVFAANGEIDVLDALGNLVSRHTWDVRTNWDIADHELGVPSVLELKLGAADGPYHLQVLGDAIQDLAGNVAIIGSASFGGTA